MSGKDGAGESGDATAVEGAQAEGQGESQGAVVKVERKKKGKKGKK